MTSSKFTTVYCSEAPVIFADHAMVQYNCLGEPDGNKQVTASQINSAGSLANIHTFQGLSDLCGYKKRWFTRSEVRHQIKSLFLVCVVGFCWGSRYSYCHLAGLVHCYGHIRATHTSSYCNYTFYILNLIVLHIHIHVKLKSFFWLGNAGHFPPGCLTVVV